MCRAFVAAFLLAASFVNAQPAPLPPTIPWNGKSRQLIVANDDRWITPAEKSGFRFTPTYDETVKWLRTLVAAAPELKMISIGRSAEGRDIWMVVASRQRAFTPEAIRRGGKPLLLAQGGIHAGEIDGKDAGLMLLRDMTVRGSRRDLLDRADFLFIPILNVDGHEHASAYGRINQRGPENMGWRTNARNLNLNRDFTKLDSEEVRAVVGVLDQWKPDLYLDLHVTDGVDYQYDITFGWNRGTGYSPAIQTWLDTTLQPALNHGLQSMGHIPGPLVFPMDWNDDVSKGLSGGNSTPRLSHGYGDLRHVASVLVENHSLKPYEQRVLGTVVLLASTLETLGRDGAALRRASQQDVARRINPVPVNWGRPDTTKPSSTIEFLGIESRTTLSPISGTTRTEWLGRPVTMRVPVYSDLTYTTVPRATTYWIPAAWSDIAGRLRMHGIAMEQIDKPRDIDVEMYRLVDPKPDTEPSEGRVSMKTGVRIERRKERFPAGSWRVSTNQPLGELITVLLEPASPDSYLRWGFFYPILQRTEYIEGYVIEPLAEQILARDPKLADEFRRKLQDDAEFRGSPTARLQWFYERTPYVDERWLLYPVGREE